VIGDHYIRPDPFLTARNDERRESSVRRNGEDGFEPEKTSASESSLGSNPPRPVW